MKIRVFIAMLAILPFVRRVHAVAVEWNLMHSEYAEVWDTGPIWDVLGGNFDRHIYFQFYFLYYGVGSLWAEAFDSEPNWLSVCVKQMDYGDVVNEASMLGPDSTYFYRSEKGEVGIHSNYTIPGDSNVYLAMCTKTVTTEPYYAYGWVEICGTEVLASAWDADGGPMIVGGGSALTPEPSSALLLLVGGALLALRRRRGGRTVRHILQQKSPGGEGRTVSGVYASRI